MRPRASRPTHRLSMWCAAILVIVAVTLSGAGASAQNVESLRARAAQITDELAALEERASELDEQYLTLTTELEELESELADKQAAVTEAQRSVEAARGEAAGYLVEAYIGAGSSERLLLPSSDMNAAVNQRVLLEIVRGDRQLAADSLDVSRQDLEVRVSELEEAEQAIAERRDAQQQVADDLDAAVGEHRQLLAGTNAQLRTAIQAEQARREAEAQAAAERQRQAEAARQERAAAQATTSTAAPSRRSSSTTTQSSATPPRTTTPAPAAPAVPASAPSSRAAGAIAAAQSQLGTPYRWAGSSPGGFDCSGLMLWSWAQVGVSLPRTSGAQYAATQRISASQLQPGDLVFFGSPIHHVGMYVGGGQMVHSPSTGDVVKISSIHRGFGGPSGYGRIG